MITVQQKVAKLHEKKGNITLNGYLKHTETQTYAHTHTQTIATYAMRKHQRKK